VAIDSQGNRRTLEKDGPVQEGDSLLTNDGRIQIRFKDGGFVALQPDTRFTVERYRYTAAGDAEDGVVMSLFKGGLRTISGLVGKRNRASYSMKTLVATIGIRGTDYALELGDKLVGNVAEGAIEVCNGAGCVSVPAGQAFLVPSLTEMPVLGERHVFLPPAQPRETRTRESAQAVDEHNSDQTAVDQAGAGAQRANGNAKNDTEPALAWPKADPAAVPRPNSSGTGPAQGNGRSSAAAAGVPPGQAKKSGAGDILPVLPAPAAVTTPPGQLKKLDTGLLDAVGQSQAKGLGPPGGIPPGQAKR
jgi:hypothetical protein